MSDEAARFWTRWTAWFVGWFAFGYVTIEHLLALGVSLPSCQLLAYVLGFGLLGHRPAHGLAALAPPGAAAASVPRSWSLLIWLVWIAGYKPLMWALIVIAALPVAIRAAARRRAAPVPPRRARSTGCPKRPCRRRPFCSTAALRFLLIAFAVALLVWGWGLDVGALAAQESPGARLAQGLLHAVVILLVADLLWKLASTAIDRQLALSAAARAGHGPTSLPTRRGAGHGCGRCCRSCASCSSSCSPRPRS